LGSMLRDNDVIGDLVTVLREADFSHDAHCRAWAAAVSLWDRHKPVDSVTLAEELSRRGWLADVGGPVFLSDLWAAAPTAANALHYAGIAREKSLLRSLARAGQETARDAQEALGPADELLAAAEERILGLSHLGPGGAAEPIAAALQSACAK